MMKILSAVLLASSVSAFAPNNNNLKQRTQTVQLSLWGEPNNKDNDNMSQALPFAPKPKLLDGSMAGDVGFDPFGFAGKEVSDLVYMREAEIKHSRLAMLAVIGWPIAEILDQPLSNAAGLPSLLTKTGESPSLLNGGLENVAPSFWVALISLSGIIEIENMKMKDEKGKDYLPGDCNFDPLNFFPKDKTGRMAMMTKEIKHGRIAMMAVLGFVVQEVIYNKPVIAETPFFFQPLF
mmetsp:Transcript_10616/g.25557  ORF Transcript_10616/g.25557 Transcript_10616/m.25557 type:complete len:236 (+) Transcript_10616:177-884(+)